MLRYILILLLVTCNRVPAISQPAYYYYNPVNAGVNNYFFNTAVSKKFLFIFTQTELSSAGFTGATTLTSLWLKSNTPANLSIENLRITLGHTNLVTPVNTFADNFNTGTPVVVLDEPTYAYPVAAGPWNDPPAGWSEIPLPVPFTYNFADNLVLQFEFEDISTAIPFYAGNGGIPITVLTEVSGGVVATSSTSRMMIGFSAGPTSPLALAASDSAVCEKFCVSFTDLSTNNPLSWQWTFEGGSPATASEQAPQNICYASPGIFDVTLVTTNVDGSDTIVMEDFITVFATPAFPVITQDGNLLTCNTFESYQWQFNTVDIPGATDASYMATASGLYTVIAGDENGCKNSASVNVVLTGIDERDHPASIRIYPNPSGGTFNLEFAEGGTAGMLHIALKNAFGETVATWEESAYNLSGSKLSVDKVANGIYYLEVIRDNQYFRQKIIILK